MSNLLQNLADKFTVLSQTRATVVDALQKIRAPNDAQFDFSKIVPDTDQSLAEIDARVIAVCELANEISANIHEELIPRSLIEKSIRALDPLKSQYETITVTLENIDNNGGPGSLDAEALTVHSKNGQVNLQLGPIFKNIWSQCDTLLGTVLSLRNIIKTRGYGDFSAALRAFSAAMDQVHEQRSALAHLKAEVLEDRDKIAELCKQASPLRDEIERLKTESEKDRKSLTEYTTEGTQSITSVRTTLE